MRGLLSHSPSVTLRVPPPSAGRLGRAEAREETSRYACHLPLGGRLGRAEARNKISRSGSDAPPAHHSIPSRRFAISAGRLGCAKKRHARGINALAPLRYLPAFFIAFSPCENAKVMKFHQKNTKKSVKEQTEGWVVHSLSKKLWYNYVCELCKSERAADCNIL